MKKKLAGLYNPYLDIVGGGEKHTLSILKALEAMGYEVHIFWNTDLSETIQKQLSISFPSNTFIHSPFSSGVSLIEKIRILSKYDVLIWTTDGSYPISSAKHNYIFCMVPDVKLLPHGMVDTIKTIGWKFIANSSYTKKILDQNNIQASILYPAIDTCFLAPFSPFTHKENIILSVGRFFSHLHSKKQDKIITLFLELKKKYKEFEHFKLILAGGVKDEDIEFIQKLRNMFTEKDNVEILTNISHDQLFSLYEKAGWFWSMTGFESDTDTHPELAEHFGIAPVEAMARGDLTFCVNSGGPKDYIIHKQTGFLFSSADELFDAMRETVNNVQLVKFIQKEAFDFVIKHYSPTAFQSTITEIFPKP